jgi:drug/metabolite transporter (DMT)-like permease
MVAMEKLEPPVKKIGPSRVSVVLALAAVYVIWGSTYLGIRYAITTIPPLLMAGSRFLVAGMLLYVYARRRGAPRPEGIHVRSGFIIGGLMVLVGNGGVVLAERSLPSGLTALVVATVPLFMTSIESLLARSFPPPIRLVALAVGFVAVGLLVDPSTLGGGDAGGILLLLLASLSWAVGSFYSKSAPRPSSGAMATSLQMLGGGALQLIAATLLGEWRDVHFDAISSASILAFGYLVFFGSLIGYTAYAWLLQVVSPSLASTYAYVNPMVAVFLGWLIAGETITVRTLVAAGMIVGSVVLITAFTRRSR